jgi:hypothetical protein
MDRVSVNKAGPSHRRKWVAVTAAILRAVGQSRTVAPWLTATLALSIVLVVAFDHPATKLLAAGFVLSATVGWLLGAQSPFPKAGAATPHRAPAAHLSPTRGPHDPESLGRQLLLKSALENLADVEALRRSPLTLLPALSRSSNSGADLRDMLVDVVTELTASRAPRDREAGQLLFDYYVKRVGSHQVVMERLCLSRPTFYRRLQRGFERLVERLDAVNEFATRSEDAIA